MVWGDQRLHDVLGKPLDVHQAYGESWEVSDHALHESIVATGPLAGKTLRQLMEQDSVALLGKAGAEYQRFPWLIKFLDAHDWLSVQVHPDEQAVARLWPGEGSKTEAWFVIAADRGSQIYAGLRPGVDEQKIREALRSGGREYPDPHPPRLAQGLHSALGHPLLECLHSFDPQPGDCMFLPAGTVHAVGGGVLLAEIQQTSDATFRLFDWNRRDAHGKSRPLHIEESLASIHWDQGPVAPVQVTDFKKGPELPGLTQPSSREPMKRQELVRCPFFELTYMRTRAPIPFGGVDRLQALVILQGQGHWHGSSCSEEVKLGQVWVLPAALPHIECRPEPTLTMLLCNLP
jgi:mannose-6-phosphate isomerase